MNRKDYQVSYNDYEEIYTNLTEARKQAKKYSKKYGESSIIKWVYDNYYNDMVIDENFYIYYEDGLLVKNNK